MIKANRGTDLKSDLVAHHIGFDRYHVSNDETSLQEAGLVAMFSANCSHTSVIP